MYNSILFDPPAATIPPLAGGVGPAGFDWVAPPSKSSTGGNGPGGVKLSVMSAAAVAASNCCKIGIRAFNTSPNDAPAAAPVGPATTVPAAVAAGVTNGITCASVAPSPLIPLLASFYLMKPNKPNFLAGLDAPLRMSAESFPASPPAFFQRVAIRP